MIDQWENEKNQSCSQDRHKKNFFSDQIFVLLSNFRVDSITDLFKPNVRESRSVLIGIFDDIKISQIAKDDY